jgi:hypothetical protein
LPSFKLAFHPEGKGSHSSPSDMIADRRRQSEEATKNSHALSMPPRNLRKTRRRAKLAVFAEKTAGRRTRRLSRLLFGVGKNK